MENKRLRFWKFTVVILVVLNISMMLTFAYRQDRGGHSKNEMEKPDTFIIRTLQFTDVQTAAYKELRNSHHDSMITLNAEGRILRKAFFDNLKRPDIPQKTDSIASLIAANQKEIERVTYYHFAQVRALCTDKQKAEFDNIISEVLQKMSRPPRQGRPGGYGGDGPPPPPDGEGPPNDNEPPPGR